MGNFQTIPLHWQDGSEKHTSRHFKCPNSELWKDPIQPLSAQMFFIFLLFEQFFFATTWYQDEVEAFQSSHHFCCGLCIVYNMTVIYGSTTLPHSLPRSFRSDLALRWTFSMAFSRRMFLCQVSWPIFFSGSRQGIATPHLHPKWWWKVGKESLLYQVLRTSSWGEWKFFGKHFHEIAWNIPN